MNIWNNYNLNNYFFQNVVDATSKTLSSSIVPKKDEPLKKVVLPEDNSNINDFKVI